MKLTRIKLKELIKEELNNLSEGSKSILKSFDRSIKKLESNIKESENELKSAKTKDEKRIAQVTLDGYKGLLSVFRKKRNEFSSKIGRQ